MAFLEERNGRFRVAFRHGGKLLRHNLGAVDRRDAEGCLARVEENLRLIERGRLEVPEGADLGLFLVSDGRVAARARPAEALSLESLRAAFLEAHGASLEDNSLGTARIHFNHLVGTLGAGFDVRRLALADLERHVARRSKMKGRGGRPLNRAIASQPTHRIALCANSPYSTLPTTACS